MTNYPKRYPIRKVSKKRAKQNAEYAKKRKAFLEAHPYCQWWLSDNGYLTPGPLHQYASKGDGTDMLHVSKIPRSTEIHHKRGRTGLRLLEEEFWMAVSREGHDWIHANPKLAYERGYLIKR